MKTTTVEGHTFVCETELEAWRAKTLLTKEAGTVKWLQREVRPGSVVYDVGANIGLYTVVAARLGARVYAFEPHLVNARSLLRNIEANGLEKQVHVITSALHSSSTFLMFNYASLKAGSSGHQLGHTTAESGKQFVPELSEIKQTTTIDHLVAEGVIKPATLVKIDVDGNEKHVLRGMSTFMKIHKPASVQVEVHPNVRQGICEIMAEHGYPISNAGRHDTMHGKHLMATGMNPEGIAHNVIFRWGVA